MSTGTTYKRLKRRFKKKLYRFLLKVNDFDFGRLRPLCYLLLLCSIVLAWAKLPTKETNNLSDTQAAVATELAASIRTSIEAQSMPSVDIVALFLSEENTTDALSLAEDETLYSFYLTGKELSVLTDTLKNWRFTVTGTQGWDAAQVTGGGVPLKEVDVESMQSLKIPGLYLAGEILDVVGDCGGFNLHWAWCSGMRAGQSAAEEVRP